MILQSKYMGLQLRSPIVVSACPLSKEIDNILRMEDAGAGAVVLFSLFEEQFQKEEPAWENAPGVHPEGLSYFPDRDDYLVGTEEYLDLIREAKERVAMPVIGSLNAVTTEGWVHFAKKMEKAGADAVEINIFYIPADLDLDGREVEACYLDIVKMVKDTVSIPVALKLNPYFSAMGNMAKQLSEAGADGLVLFNRFYQPDFNIDDLQVVPSLAYSQPDEIRLPLLWIAALYGRLDASLAATTGVQGSREIIKYLLAGADVVMTASALYKYGIEHIRMMTNQIDNWAREMGFDSVEDFRGILSQQNVKDKTAYERANYVRILERVKR